MAPRLTSIGILLLPLVRKPLETPAHAMDMASFPVQPTAPRANVHVFV